MFIIAADSGGHFPELDLTFINRGISGNRVIRDFPGRWQHDAIDEKPDVLSVLAGVNDVNLTFAKSAPVRLDDKLFEQTYDRLLADALRTNPKLKIILCEPFLVKNEKTKTRWDERRDDMQKAQAAVERLGAKYHAPVVHFQKMFDEAAKRAPMEHWIWDGVHPTYSGHQLMADEWRRVVLATWPPG